MFPVVCGSTVRHASRRGRQGQRADNTGVSGGAGPAAGPGGAPPRSILGGAPAGGRRPVTARLGRPAPHSAFSGGAPRPPPARLRAPLSSAAAQSVDSLWQTDGALATAPAASGTELSASLPSPQLGQVTRLSFTELSASLPSPQLGQVTRHSAELYRAVSQLTISTARSGHSAELYRSVSQLIIFTARPGHSTELYRSVSQLTIATDRSGHSVELYSVQSCQPAYHLHSSARSLG